MALALGRLWPRGPGRSVFLPQQAVVSPHPRTFSALVASAEQHPRSGPCLQPAGFCQGLVGPASAWSLQQVRAKARGNTYQPNNRKRKRTHGWIKRISTPAGIEVILRRMLKGRKSLSH